MDELTLMWQSAPMRRDDVSGRAESWFEGVPDARSSDPETKGDPLPTSAPPSGYRNLRLVPSAVSSADSSESDDCVPLERLEAQICSLAAHLAASTRDWPRLIADFDRRKGWAQWGVKSCSHWLSWACSVAPGAAREYVRVALALVTLPLLDGAFAAGRLSYSKIRALTRVADRIDEQTLLEQGLVHTASQLERIVRGYRKAEGSGLDQQRRRRARWFFDDDGMLVITARLTSDEGAMVVAALEQAQESVFITDQNQACEVTDDGQHPGAKSAADALITMAQNALAAGPVDSSGDDQHLLVLHADAEIFGLDSPTRPEEARRPEVLGADELITSARVRAALCQIENGPGVDRSTAERIACDTGIVAVLRSAVPGEQLRLGRKTRKISAALRRALRIRDGGCQFPGCHRRRHLQAHHVVHWLYGGVTDLENLLLLCRHHHMVIHEEGFTVAWSAGWVFRRPDGIPVPDNRPLDRGPEPFGGTVDQTLDPMHPELIRPGWRGERFSLADSVAVLCEARELVSP